MPCPGRKHSGGAASGRLARATLHPAQDPVELAQDFLPVSRVQPATFHLFRQPRGEGVVIASASS